MTFRERTLDSYIDDLRWTTFVLENPENEIPERERKIANIKEIMEDFRTLKKNLKSKGAI